MSALIERIRQVRGRIAAAARAAGRAPSEIELVAISKTFPASAVVEAAQAGLRIFGENRVQEAIGKIAEVRAALPFPLCWHLVGQLQRNKARRAAELFDLIHSVDRSELARALERSGEALDRRLDVLINVNIDEEPQKGGTVPAAAAALLAELDSLPHLRAIGLMAIPRTCEDPEQVRPSFARLRALLEELNSGRPAERRIATLSMGMSADYEVAIREGSTCVRIGSAIFGRRETG